MPDEVVVVVGLGEVGKPLIDILSRLYECIGVDLQPVEVTKPCSVLHICIPFQIKDFVDTVCLYIAKYSPRFTVINSTVSPGTTRAVAERSGAAVAYSPVRGKHIKMESDMLLYKKFVAADDPTVTDAVMEHYAGAGFPTGRFRTWEVGEIAKLLETTWLGVLVAWAQEAERIAEKHGATHDEVNMFTEEVAFIPKVFPGVIGGHCVMPNIAILRSVLRSDFLDVIVASNELKTARVSSATEKIGA